MKIYTDQEFEALKQTSPLDLFDEWLSDAKRLQPVNHNAMTLATLSEANTPQARTVLLKGRDTRGFCFFSNRESRKGRALEIHPQAALLFYWVPLNRQILIEGNVAFLSAAETATYYHSRARDSRIGAWVSHQSRPLKSYAQFNQTLAAQQQAFADQEPPLPPYWQGYVLHPQRIEFWQEGEYRLHRRIAFVPQGEGWSDGELLQP